MACKSFASQRKTGSLILGGPGAPGFRKAQDFAMLNFELLEFNCFFFFRR
jgi:hypothetical protein